MLFDGAAADVKPQRVVLMLLPVLQEFAGILPLAFIVFWLHSFNGRCSDKRIQLVSICVFYAHSINLGVLAFLFWPTNCSARICIYTSGTYVCMHTHIYTHMYEYVRADVRSRKYRHH